MRKNFYLLLKALGNALQCKKTKNRIWMTNKCYTCSQGTLVFHFNLTIKKTFFPLMLLKKFWRTKSFTLKGAGIIQKCNMLYLCFAPIPALISESMNIGTAVHVMHAPHIMLWTNKHTRVGADAQLGFDYYQCRNNNKFGCWVELMLSYRLIQQYITIKIQGTIVWRILPTMKFEFSFSEIPLTAHSPMVWRCASQLLVCVSM